MKPQHSILVRKDATLRSVITRMLEYHPYRVCLTDGESTAIENIISQSDIVKFIYEHRELLVDDREKTLLEIPDIGTAPVQCVKEKDSVKDACIFLKEKNIQAVAVVNEIGEMRGAVSPTTFRNVLSHDGEAWISFDSPLSKYEDLRDPGWVAPEEKFDEVLKRFVVHRYHRIFVVSDAQHPGKIISLTDILAHFMQHTSEYQEGKKKLGDMIHLKK